MHPLLFWMGYCRLFYERERAAEVINFCSWRELVYREPKFAGEEFTFLCSPRTAAHLKKECPPEHWENHGLPAVLKRYQSRLGVFVGLLLAALLVWGSGQVVWRIQIDGNEHTSDEEIIELLSQCGMEVGDRISSLHTAALENRMLIESETVSWISINIRGTVARVEVREILPTPEEEHYDAANLVASRSGIIQWLEDTRGNVAVQIGDVVGEGDLLVGGLYAPEGGGLRYTVAKGKVMARTERDFSVTVPRKYEKKTYTGACKIEKYLIFFKNEIKFYGNTGNLYERCDTIDTVEYFELSGACPLPVGIRTVRYMEYCEEETERTEEEMRHLVYERLSLAMEGEVPEGALLRKSVKEIWAEEGLTLHCQGEFLENIAQIKEIEIDGTKNRKN